MAIPLIVGGILALGSAVVGIKKGAEAKGNFSDAKRIGERAAEKYDKQKETFEKEEKSLKKRIQDYGQFKVNIYTKTMRDCFLPVYKKFKKHELDDLDGYKPIRSQDIKSVEQNIDIAEKIASGSVGGLFGGAATGAGMAAGAWGLAGGIGIASTGTAISTLSGAAFTKAALAWLGGGALAAGGLGMAGGAAVLGGLVAGPVIAITGFAIAKKSETALTEAHKYRDDVDAKCAEMKKIITGFQALYERCNELQGLVEEFDQRLIDQINELQTIVKHKKGFLNFIRGRRLNDDDKKIIRITGVYANAITDLLNLPLVNSDGRANPEAVHKMDNYRSLLEHS